MSDEAAPPKSIEDAGDRPEDDEDDEVPGYKAPEPKTLNDIVNADQEDESLRKYKEALLGAAAGGAKVEPYPEDKRHVIVKRLVLVTEDRPEVSIDLDQDLDVIKQKKFVLKEGAKFQIRIEFYVQREIVTGLKYVQKTHTERLKLKVKVDKMTHMCGAFSPKMELQSSTTKDEFAPTGFGARGQYSITSLFTDDYKNEYLKWDWTLEVKKDWDDSA